MLKKTRKDLDTSCRLQDTFSVEPIRVEPSFNPLLISKTEKSAIASSLLRAYRSSPRAASSITSRETKHSISGRTLAHHSDVVCWSAGSKAPLTLCATLFHEILHALNSELDHAILDSLAATQTLRMTLS
jgi:hypothetical protein